MNPEDRVYVRLQKHLDGQAVGFPATRSGVEIEILKHIFTPQEAEIATFLAHKPETIGQIYGKAAHLVDSPEALARILVRIFQKGGIESKKKNGEPHFWCSPLVVGMYEAQHERLTPEFIKAFDRYTSDPKFGIAFLGTALPQMRTVPVAKSIQPQQHVSTFDQISELLRTAEAPFAVFACICRKKKSMTGGSCKVTQRKETCLAVGWMAQSALEKGLGREVSKDEALAIIDQNQKEGLVLQPSNTQTAEFICSCCGCCCGMLAMHKVLAKPLDFWSANYYAVVDPGTCKSCGSCEKRCQVAAIRLSEEEKTPRVDLNRCIGCGVCVAACPTRSLALSKKRSAVKPPQDREELYDIIMARKQGAWGKIKLTGKLIYDAVRTGQTHLLRP
ncbi:MAG: 4Fe-4S dicluster domain-containing protein [Desulfobacteraceae bacterium]|nr:MAG: 4Fe-4S dicluster domain-containing protein [Desulfobacteraceae bacterium]